VVNLIIYCKNCNKPIKHRLNGKGRQRTSFCSDKCRAEFFNKKKLQYDDYMPGKDFGIEICAYCGNEFIKTHQRRIYCSTECKYNAIDKKVDEYNEKMKFQCRGSYLGSTTHFKGSTYVFSSDDDKKKLVATFTPDDGVYNANISDLPDDF
jgi:endogenous inhibitor of DNA gyrase (YacG/DUF329 family)